MANSRSALKRGRKTETQTARNKSIRSRVKTYRRKVLSAIEGGDAKIAQAAYVEFASVADKAGRSNLLHPNATNRLKSGLTKRIQSMA